MAGEINFGLLDPNMPAQVGGSFQQGRTNALAMQQVQQESAINALRMRQAQKGIESQNALNKVYQEAGGDTQKAIAGLKAAGQYEPAMALEKGLSEQDKAALELKKTQLDMGIKHFDYISQALSGVNDQASYEIAKQHIAQTLGPESLANIPAEYNPEIIKQKQMQALPMKEQMAEQHKLIDEQLNQAKFGYQQQQDVRQLGVTMRGQNISAANQAAALGQAERHFQVGQESKGKEAGAATKASEDERKAAGWLSQADNAYKNMLGAMGKESTASEPGLLEAISPEQVKGMFQSESRQQFKQGVDSLSEALLRAATGAGVNESEAKQKIKELTPSYLDKPAVKKQKLDAIPVYIASLKTRAGRAAPEGYITSERGQAGGQSGEITHPQYPGFSIVGQ